MAPWKTRLNAVKEINLCGMVCPMPVLKTKRALTELDAGQDLCVLTDDPHAVEDIELFAKQSGHTLVSQETVGAAVTRHVLRKAPTHNY